MKQKEGRDWFKILRKSHKISGNLECRENFEVWNIWNCIADSNNLTKVRRRQTAPEYKRRVTRQEYRHTLTMFNTYSFITDSFRLIWLNVLRHHLQKPRNCATTYTSLRSFEPNYTPKEGHGQTNILLTFTGPCIANIFAEYNQQDEKFHNLFISVRRSTCFRRFFRPSSGVQNYTYSVRYWSDKYLTLYVQF